jgi:hypothetical protein
LQPAIQQWTVRSSVAPVRNYLSQLDVPFEDIQRYLVYRIPGTAELPVPLPSSSTPVQESLARAEQVEATAVPEVKESAFLPLILSVWIQQNRIHSFKCFLVSLFLLSE